MSRVPIDNNRDDGQEPGCRKLLAMHEVRRSLQRVAVADRPVWCTAMALKRSQVVRALEELVVAIDRRVPQVQRVGEAKIACDAAALRAQALKRLAEVNAD